MPVKVLIVEDEALLALELSDVLADHGMMPVGPAADLKSALHLASAEKPNLALVDVHLGDGPTGIEVARRLRDMAIPAVFVTANVKRLPPDLAGAIGVIEKPYTAVGLDNAVDYLGSLVTGCVDEAPPPGLRIAEDQALRFNSRTMLER